MLFDSFIFVRMKNIVNLSAIYKTVLQSMESAAAAIMDVYNDEIFSEIKKDGSPVTQADIASSKILIEQLSGLGFPILDEESKKADFKTRRNWEYYWCIDPLDGTKEFISRNGEFAINIALIHQNRAVFGAICSPLTKEVILGGEDFGVFTSKLDGIYRLQEISIPERNKMVTLIISRSHFTGFSKEFVEELQLRYGEIAYFEKGSALKFFDLANGNADIYARFGPTMEWDIAAGHAILRQLGGEIFEYQTSQALTYNKESLYNPKFVAYTAPLLKDLENAKF